MSLTNLVVLTTGARLWLSVIPSLLAGAGSVCLIVVLNHALVVPASELSQLGLQFALLSAATLLLRWKAETGFVELRQTTLARLRQRMSEQLSRLAYPDSEARGPARLFAVLTQDVAQVAGLLAALPRLVIPGAIVLGCLSYLAWLSWRVFLLALLVVIVGSLARQWAGRHAAVHLRAGRRAEDTLFSQLHALGSGAKELKLHAQRRDAFLRHELTPTVSAVQRARERGLSIQTLASTWGNFLFFAVIGSVVFGMVRLFDADPRIQSGYTLAFLYMMHPMEMLMDTIPELSRARIALEHMTAALGGRDALAELPALAADATAVQAPLTIGFHRVTHTYRRDTEDGVFRLGPLDLELNSGELVFLIGGNGSGKTTLAKLLVGLYEPESGHITLNGTSVTASGRAAYRQVFSAIFSDFHVFDSLLGMERLRLDERAGALLEALELQHEVRVDKGVLSTTKLSSGQRKRLALLVAILDDRPVYVFDEWAADQDPEYKRVFYERVLPELRNRGKAVLVITHDDQYFQLADRCIRLEGGRCS